MWNPIIISLLSSVLELMNFERCFPSTMGMKPFFERFILNPFSIFSIYVDYETPSTPLDLSIDPNSKNIGCFAKVFHGKLFGQQNLYF